MTNQQQIIEQLINDGLEYIAHAQKHGAFDATTVFGTSLVTNALQSIRINPATNTTVLTTIIANAVTF